MMAMARREGFRAGKPPTSVTCRWKGNEMSRTAAADLTLAVPGGLAGQVFAIGYAAWLAVDHGRSVHLQFHDVGTSISRLAVRGLLSARTTEALGITYSEELGNWPPPFPAKLKTRVLDRTESEPIENGSVFSRTVGSPLAHAIRQALFAPKLRVITRADCLGARRGATLIGYPSDMQIIEDSWPQLSRIIASSSSPDFAHGAGLQDSVSVHWRLGDYVGNAFHGAVSWRSISDALKLANRENNPVRVFTDSPNLARDIIQRDFYSEGIEITSEGIWSDLFKMTRSRVFIGSNSGVSFLAALALRQDNPLSKTWLPDRWFLNTRADRQLARPVNTLGGSYTFPPNLSAHSRPQ